MIVYTLFRRFWILCGLYAIVTAVGMLVLRLYVWSLVSSQHNLHFIRVSQTGTILTYQTASMTTRENDVPIVYWRSEDLRAIDSRRIFLHEMTGSGDLNAQQSCVVESAAKHNPDRTIQLFMVQNNQNSMDLKTKKLKLSRNAPWLSVLRHYSNVQVVLYNETDYFSDTALYDWYTRGKWRQNTENRDNYYLSSYIKTVSLFRGGGIFLDLNAAIAIKPFVDSKWNNFIVKQSHPVHPSATIQGEFVHFVHGHHLIDMLILKLKKNAYDHVTIKKRNPFADALDQSVTRICGGLTDDTNKCLDVTLFNDQEVYLSNWLDSWRSISDIRHQISLLHPFSQLWINTSDAVLMQWGIFVAFLRQEKSLNDSLQYETLISMLLADHCPHTVNQHSALHFQP